MQESSSVGKMTACSLEFKSEPEQAFIFLPPDSGVQPVPIQWVQKVHSPKGKAVRLWVIFHLYLVLRYKNCGPLPPCSLYTFMA